MIVTSMIILTAVAFVGMGVIGFSNSKVQVFETSLLNSASNNTNQINENLNIENIAFCTNCGGSNSKNVINVTLTNTGTVSVKASQIQVNSTVINSYFGTSSLPATISPGKSYLVSATLASGKKWGSENPDTITVTTSRNSVFTTQVAPR
jgi:hypothetical protein